MSTLGTAGAARSFTRRQFLGATLAATMLISQRRLQAVETSAKFFGKAEPSNKSKLPRYRIAGSDLMMLKRQKLGALPLAHELGLDGVEVDMGGLGDRPTFENTLSDPAVRQQYVEKLAELNLEICSLAMTGFFSQSFPDREGVEKTVQDCIDTMVAMKVKTAFCHWA